jgi:cell wall-associated NlpC family hydrolase
LLDLTPLIGVPFKYGGRGPEHLDCYGLVKLCYEAEHKVELPEFRSPDEQARILATIVGNLPMWEEVPAAPGRVVLFKIMGILQHVGYILPGDSFIHTWERSGGVVIERLSAWKSRIAGCYRFAGPSRG